MKKKFIIGIMASVLTIGLLSGCGKDSTDEKKDTTIVADKESSNDTTDNSIQDTTEETPTVSYEGDVSGLSNEPVNWGAGVNKDADGRPSSPVQFQQKYSNYAVDFIKENEKVIYLTFDEGYENGYTAQILDVLKEKKVSAVFFITMDYAKASADLVKRIIDEGHVVGAHSVTHPAKGMPSISIEKQISEYQQLHNYVKDNFKYEMYLFRPPVGIFSEQSLAIAQKCGYRSVLWSFAYADWDPEKQPTEADGLEKTIGKLHNGAIYLLHAVSKTNTNILGQFIDEALNQGYVFKEYK